VIGIKRTHLAAALALFLVVACTDKNRDAAAPITKERTPPLLFKSGAKISGVNGIHFGPDGLLYAASVIGSTISVVDTQAKKIVSEYGPAQGVFGPDDVAFNSEGDFYWTSILTGQVAGFLSDGSLVTAAELGPGVNPITFSDDDRLFVSQCFFGTGLYEVDPSGTAPARSIRDDLGPGCGLNGMDWGPDGRLYGPRWFNGEVISVDVETGESRTEVTGLMVPAAVKFDSRGRLHILDTGSGEVIRQEADGRNAVVATLSQGLDNFAFDKADNLFVSSYADGFISKVTSEGVEEVLPGGLSHPGGLVVLEGNLVVADIQSVRAVNARTGDDVWTLRNIFQFAPIGTATAIANHGADLLLTSWLDNTVKVLDPISGKITLALTTLNIPVSAVKFGDHYAVTLHGDNTLSLFADDGSLVSVLSDDFDAPTHVVHYGDRLLVSDRKRGEIVAVDSSGNQEVIVAGLNSPEGIAVLEQTIFIYEGDTGEIKRHDASGTEVIATLTPGSPAATPAQPPSMVFNGLTIHAGALFATDERERAIYRISL
jgi:sugar lactone lactonase YvrE